MAAPGGLRPSRDAPGSAGRVGRGWQVVRDQWRDFLEQRQDIPERVASELARVDDSPQRASLSKEASDRIVDRIIGHFSQDSPEEAAKIATWKRAKKIHSEVRAALGDINRAGQEASVAAVDQRLAGMGFSASALFPTEWWQLLTADLLAELVVDAFVSTFCDAFVDGAITLLEVAEGWGPPRLQQTLAASASAPALAEPRTWRPLNRPFQAVPPYGDRGLWPAGGEPPGPSEGFLLAAPAGEGQDPWTATRFHASQPLDTFQGRIRKATELQRPNRRLMRPRERADDLRKFSWPMTATNLPDVWEHASRPRRAASSSGPRQPAAEQQAAAEPERSWLLDIGRDGKTVFPYSLASHRAFLESQPNARLREKAHKIAPLRMTGAY